MADPNRNTSGDRKLRFEALEHRAMLAVFMVTNLGDAPVSGPGQAPGTLRQAIFDANNSPGPDSIQFASHLSGIVDLNQVGDTSESNSALLITSPITIQGNANGITLRRAASASEMRLFRIEVSGSLTLESIMLTGGLARGAIDSAGRGGAILNSGGTLNITASTIYANQVIGGNASSGGTSGRGLGGAIYNDGGSISLFNTTISGNSAQSGAGGTVPTSFGGGIYHRNGSLQVYNSTITNSTSSTGRGIYALGVNGTATVELYSSIIGQEDYSPSVIEFITTFDTMGQIFVTGANNLIRRQFEFHEITVSDADPMLQPLANNGGPTLTHAITSDSPAWNAGANPGDLSTDQRGAGYGRVLGGQADIGAFELQTFAGPALLGDYNENGIVDAADFVIWRKMFGTSVPHFSGADGNGDGSIEIGDYAVWRQSFGRSNQSASSADADGSRSSIVGVAFESVEVSLAICDSLKTLTQQPPRRVSTVFSLGKQIDTLLAVVERIAQQRAQSDEVIRAVDQIATEDVFAEIGEVLQLTSLAE